MPVIQPLEKKKMNRDLLEDILKRLKSTSIHNPKFSEAVDILLNLIKVEDD